MGLLAVACGTSAEPQASAEMMLEGDRIVWIDANHIITASGQTLCISQR